MIMNAYPFFGEDENEQEKWIVYLVYDLLHQFGADLEGGAP